MNTCATCGHARISHIHEEGACFPGFRCEAECQRFVDSARVSDPTVKAILGEGAS